jgi:fucose 4-O-acetylase-like acetyltransferase
MTSTIMQLSLSLSTFFFFSPCRVILFICYSVTCNKKWTCSWWSICVRRSGRMMTQIRGIFHSNAHQWKYPMAGVAIHLCQYGDTATAVTTIFVRRSSWLFGSELASSRTLETLYRSW